MKKFFKEPLLHFLLIGAAFFLLFNQVNEPESDEQTIVIDQSDVEEVISKFELQWNRPPTEDELIAILGKRMEEEVFYQEALKLNLDHNDEIIKRRLAQKMEFISKDISDLKQPSQEELKAFYEEHKEDYFNDAEYSFYQIYFSPDERENWLEDASKVLEEMDFDDPEEVSKYGDRIALPSFFEETPTFHVSRQMGEKFTNAIAGLPTGSWQGPIRSGFGAHLVFIVQKTERMPAPYDDVLQEVFEDYNYQQQLKTEADLVRSFKSNYKLVLDLSEDQGSLKRKIESKWEE